MCSIHRRAFHFWIRESHLHMNIVDTLQKVAEITTSGFHRAGVPITKIIITAAFEFREISVAVFRYFCCIEAFRIFR